MYPEVHAETIAYSPQLQEKARQLLSAVARRDTSLSLKGDLDERTRHALDVVCDLARSNALRAEELLVILKNCWRRLPESRSVDRGNADVLPDQVITHCIKEFYRQ